MKKISFWLFILAFSMMAARAQDASAQQQMDEINGRLQNILEVQAAQGKHIDALEKEIADQRDKLNQPGANNYASTDDLQKLAGQVQELAKKQQVDNDLILKEIEKLGKIGGGSTRKTTTKTSTTTSPDTSTPAAGGKQNGFYYEIKSGNTLSAIAKEYSDQGHKVTVKQILDANFGLDPKNLPVGKKIFIPAPAQ